MIHTWTSLKPSNFLIIFYVNGYKVSIVLYSLVSSVKGPIAC